MRKLRRDEFLAQFNLNRIHDATQQLQLIQVTAVATTDTHSSYQYLLSTLAHTLLYFLASYLVVPKEEQT
jgi:hypothetical protein